MMDSFAKYDPAERFAEKLSARQTSRSLEISDASGSGGSLDRQVDLLFRRLELVKGAGCHVLLGLES